MSHNNRLFEYKQASRKWVYVIKDEMTKYHGDSQGQSSTVMTLQRHLIQNQGNFQEKWPDQELYVPV